jgi:molybdopterin synthase catalytic subunit
MTTSVRTVTVRLRLFARYAELLGNSEIVLDVPEPATVGAVLARLRAEVPAAAALPARPLIAVNLRQTALDAAVAPGDEVALLPPLSGG